MALSKKQRDELEDEALKAFGGRSVNLGHGFRIMRDVGQVVAVYWSDNMPGNDVEIALCDSRLTDSYDLRIVRRWIDREQRLSGRECNIHKHGSDWPIIGFAYADALAFLGRCRSLRRGFLSRELLDVLNSGSQASRMDPHEDLGIALAALRPTSKKAVIDLLKAAGVDVSGWYNNKDGTPAANPRSNPAYCYNWSFGGNGEPVVACLWHGELKIEDGKIVFKVNLRDQASQLLAIAETSGEDPEIRNRARTQARRASVLDDALAAAYAKRVAVRVIVNEGLRRPADMLGKESSKVELRELDDMPWHVLDYDDQSGQLRMARDASVEHGQPDGAADQAPAISPAPRFVDQHTIVSDDVEKRETSSFVYSRSRAVRDAALARAGGVCELCGKRGFVTRAGTIFLETHHVVPLNENGADSEQNVAALCPNHHREAHFGENAARIREQLQTMLAEIYAETDSTATLDAT